MARRKKEHETGDRAIKLVLASAPDSWVDQEQKKDYSIDLKFEVFQEERTTGLEFGVQVRGTNNIRFSADQKFVICKIEVEALVDHLEKRRYPVYLFRVDNVSGIIYWEFLQRFACGLLHEGSREQKETTIRIPVSQVFEAGKFERHLAQHVAFLENLHPGSITAAIGKASRDIEIIDPRLRVQTCVTNGIVTQHLTAIEPLVLTVLAHGTDANALDSCWRTGCCVNLMAAEITGSPLFEKLGPISLSITPSPDKGFRLTLIGTLNGVTRTSIDVPDVEVIGGVEEIRIQTSSTHPISLDGTFFASAVSAPTVRSQFHFTLSRWVGIGILDLPHFDSTSRFVEGLQVCDAVQSVIRKGSMMIRSLPTPIPSAFGVFSELLECVTKARELAIHYKVNPAFSLDFNPEDIRWLHWLVFDRQETPTTHLILRDKPSTRLGLIKRHLIPSIDSPGHFRQCVDGVTFDLFSEAIQVGPITLDYRAIEVKELVRVPKTVKIAHDEAVIEFVCTTESTVSATLDRLDK